MFWLYLLYYVLLLIVSLLGLLANILGLPGLWFMVAAAVAYSLATGGLVLSWPAVAVLAILAGAAEVVEFVAGAAGGKAAGGTWRGIAGALVGGVVGGLVGVPVPVLGPVLGAVLGAAIGAGVMELTGEKPDIKLAGNVALGAARGRFWGIVSKLGFGSVMLLILIVYAFPLPRDAPAVPVDPPGDVSLRSTVLALHSDCT